MAPDLVLIQALVEALEAAKGLPAAYRDALYNKPNTAARAAAQARAAAIQRTVEAALAVGRARLAEGEVA